MRIRVWTFLALVPMAVFGVVAAAAQRGVSPAAERPPETVTPQTYAPELIAAGEPRFVARCGFCHGRDAGGGEGGPDLTRSDIVARDVYGSEIGRVVRAAGEGVHDLVLEEGEIDGIVAFIHARKAIAEAMLGGRQFVEPEDLRTGDAAAGAVYFNGAGGCAGCHSPTGDLAGLATRLEGLQLMQRMLAPRASQPPLARVTTSSGEVFEGRVASRDEFRVAIRMADGEEREWSASEVVVEVDDPMDAHFEQLGRYTDKDMHDVYAYLETLR